MTVRPLARELAKKARGLRDLALAELHEGAEGSPVRRLHAAFAPLLCRDPAGFADDVAQTLAYGLMAARWLGAEGRQRTAERFTRETALHPLPFMSPFLRRFFEIALGSGDPAGSPFSLAVDEIVALLAGVDPMPAGDGADPWRDPVLHFYEPFLMAYDRGLRSRRGVFFTPRPVVSFIVERAHEALQRDFGLEDGLASTESWGEVARRFNGGELPEGVTPEEPFVRVVDPATGTGTFLCECVDVIERTMKERWRRELGAATWEHPEIGSRWSHYVARSLLPRLHGWEVMMAPYAVAHLHLAFKLARTGAALPEGARIHVRLGNALEAASREPGKFTVLLTNPPYSKSSANRGAAAEELVSDYKRRVAGEVNVQPLSDDYVKFIALAGRVTHPEASVVGLVTNRSFLEGVLHRGLRAAWLEEGSRIEITDLHGDTNVGEAAPPGTRNENVFTIMQGVCISMRVRRPGPREPEVLYAEVWGSRAEKVAALGREAPLAHREIRPEAPYYLFTAKGAPPAAGEMARWAPLSELFGESGMGVKSRRDHFLIAQSRAELVERLRPLLDHGPLDELRGALRVTDNDQWSLGAARRIVREVGIEAGIQPILYRPFDTRHIFYHREIIERGDARWPVMRHVLGGGLSLLSARHHAREAFSAAFVCRGLSEMKAAESSRGSYAFPLYLAGGAGSPESNLKLEKLGAAAALRSPEEGLAYIYAILHAPSYRSRYAASLRVDFPRIPPCEDAALLSALVRLGHALIECHLLEGEGPADVGARWCGEPGARVLGAEHAEGAVWLNRQRTAAIEGVPREVYDFAIGGYRVCEKWLKDRKGRILSEGDVAHYKRIVAALAGTIRFMREIDGVIEAHGGWPRAFA